MKGDDESTAQRRTPRSTAEAAETPAAPKRPWWKPWGGAKTQKPRPAVAEKADEPRPSTKFDQAVLLVKEFKFEPAMRLLKDVLEENPNYGEAWRWLGDCQYNLLSFDEAIAAYIKARELDPTNYLALRGKGFSHLHLGRRDYKEYKEAVDAKETEKANEAMTSAHENFRLSLELLRECMRLVPADNEAMYGRAMAAEGTSRKLYSNAVVLLRSDKTTQAHAWAERCLEIIDEGIEAAKYRINEYLDDPNPRALVAGLFYRRAVLLKEFDRAENAVIALQKAIDTQKSILGDIDKDNKAAIVALQNYDKLMQTWRAELEK